MLPMTHRDPLSPACTLNVCQCPRDERMDTTSIPAAYMPADDLYVGIIGVDSKSRATVHHPMRGVIEVACADLRDAPGQTYSLPRPLGSLFGR